MRALLLLVIPAVTAAQSSAVDTARLASVVTTATRVETVVQAPAAVSVLVGDSLRARGITHLADALRLVPGVTVVTTSSFGSQASLFVRGGQSNYVRVLLDGVPLNEPGGAIDLGALTLDNIARVEVVRGPASVLYGADAVAGVIQLVSRNASASGAGGAVALDGGSYGQREVSLTGRAGSSRVAFAAALADRASDGILAFNNGYRNRTAAASVRLLPDTRTEATLSARWQDATYHVPTESDGSVGDHNAENGSRRLVLAFAGRRVLNHTLTASWNLASGESRPRSSDAPDTPADTLGFYGFISRGTVTRRSAGVQLTGRAFATQSLTVGGELSRDHERSSTQSLSEYGVDDGAFVAARNDRALYLQAVGAFGGHGSYQLGARLDDNSAFGTFRTVRLGAAWAFVGSWRARGSLGSAFRAPSFFENFATGYVTGNPALVPEQSHSRELGLDGRLLDAAISITAYQQRFRDLIQYTSKTASPTTPNYYNVAGANASGVEAEVALAPLAGVRTRLMYSWTDTRVTNAGFNTGNGAVFVEGEALVRRPAHSARLEFARAVTARADLTIGAAYTGQSHDRDFGVYPAVPVLIAARTLMDAAGNLRLSAASQRIPLSVRLRVDNLTGVRYQGIFGFQAPGRVVRVGMTLGRM